MHRWGALIAAVPLALVIATGLLLQVKKQVPWVQPPTQKGTGQVPGLDWPRILAAAQAAPEANVTSWDDVDRLDVRPGKGLIKIQCKNSWELQIDASTGDLLSSKYRRSDWIEALHDGSFFHDNVKLWIFLPSGLILMGLWVSGVYLWYLPIQARRKKIRRLQERNERIRHQGQSGPDH